MRLKNEVSALRLVLDCICIVVAVCFIGATTSDRMVESVVNPSDAQEKANPKTQVPTIGVLTEVLRDYKRFVDVKQLHIAASYVKWIEMSGAKVVPVLLNQNDSYYEQIFERTNGLLFPGGDNLLDPNRRTPMMEAAKRLYKLAVDANDRGDFYPIWGTCLGFELLAVLSSGRNLLSACKANDLSLGVEFKERGKMFANSSYMNLDQLGQDFPKVIMDLLSTTNLSYNFHHKCLTDKDLNDAQLGDFYRPLAYSSDPSGYRFIAIMEAINYPFYGVQFHPEKSPFEFVVNRNQRNIPHSRQAIAASRFFADFFVNQAQYSGHNPMSANDPRLIYSYDAMYTAPKNDMYEQRYLFPYEESSSISSEEFLDHIPAEDEEIPE